MKLHHRVPEPKPGEKRVALKEKRPASQQRSEIRKQSVEEKVKEYLRAKLEEAGKKGRVVNVIVYQPGAKRINVYGPRIDDSHLAYRLSIRSSGNGLHHSNWKRLTAYEKCILVRRAIFPGPATPDEWVALVNIHLNENHEYEVVDCS